MNENQEEIPKISLNAMEGQYHPSTLRMQGTCNEQPVMVLIDGGSTHNFIKATVANKLSFSNNSSFYLPSICGEWGFN